MPFFLQGVKLELGVGECGCQALLSVVDPKEKGLGIEGLKPIIPSSRLSGLRESSSSQKWRTTHVRFKISTRIASCNVTQFRA